MRIRLSVSTRFILAVLHLSASIAEDFGQSVIGILSKQYPEMIEEMKMDDKYSENAAASIGHKMLSIARKQLQYNDQDAYDAIQDMLTYMVSSKFDFKSDTKKGKSGASTWRQALNNVYSNLHAKAMSNSFKKFRKGKYTDEEMYSDLLWRKSQHDVGSTRYKWTPEDVTKLEQLEQALVAKGVNLDKITPTKLRRKNVRDRTIDEAFGKRGEDGGEPSGGLGKIPQDMGSTEGLPVDEKAAKKSFLNTIDEIVPDMVNNLPATQEGLRAQKFLFDFIFQEDGSGTFLPDIKANMGQASAFRDYLEEMSMGSGPNAQEASDILKKYGKRWSGFVGDTRVRLMKSIQEFVEKYLPESEYEQLWDEFFSDVTPQAAERANLKGEEAKIQYQRDLDLRKILRMQERASLKLLSPKEEQDLNKLRKRVQKEISDEYMKKMVEINRINKSARGRNVKVPEKPLTLDEQLKIVMNEEGDKIKKQVEEEFKLKLESDEKQKLEQEEAEAIADEAIEEVDARRAISSFLNRFMPEYA